MIHRSPNGKLSDFVLGIPRLLLAMNSEVIQESPKKAKGRTRVHSELLNQAMIKDSSIVVFNDEALG